ncbi:hypothetical protein Enr13x_23480 [Stieleria neptunia]|uniref:Uncharacterized protein n=1 Tax=Stieleria neptunia TaxID=2527979 RepID=A0A518HNS8_9BACT|nr:hypothetical protein Enr13x_23480 [Stieleria neptunia]
MVLDVIQGVLRCPEVRFGDQCHTAELIWRLIAEEISAGSVSATDTDEITSRFNKVWRNSSDEESLPELADKWIILASVHGLDRFLSKRTFRSTLFDEEQQEQSYAWRQAIATSVLSGLVERLIAAFAYRRHLAETHLACPRAQPFQPCGKRDQIGRFWIFACPSQRDRESEPKVDQPHSSHHLARESQTKRRSN